MSFIPKTITFNKYWYTNHNSDGLIKCLPQAHDKFVTFLNIYAQEPSNIYKILWHPDSFIARDSTVGLVGRRTGALFFARHRDYFIVTRNFIAVYLDLIPFRSFTVTLGCTAIYQDWQKIRHRDPPPSSGQAPGT